MQLSGITMPGYRVYEYLLVLNPHEELRNRIMQVKKEFFRYIQSINSYRWQAACDVGEFSPV